MQPTLSKRIQSLSVVLLISILGLVVVIDQWVKQIIVTELATRGPIIVVENFFHIILTYNRGSAFGLFSNIEDDSLRMLALGISTLVAVTAVMFFLLHDYYDNRRGQVALALILGGAIGNIIDRVRLGMVVDYLDFFWKTHHYPAFNIADSCICIGVGLLLFFVPRRSEDRSKVEAQAL